MLQFTQSNLLSALEECDEHLLDKLEFGVVGMNASGAVERYNAAESKIAGLSAGRVIGKNFFTEVAPCTNNFLVAQRFQDEETLDVTIPYVFTVKMRPRKVELRLLKAPAAKRMYLVVRDRT